LRIIEIEEELNRVMRKDMLNIQPLAIRSLLHSSSSSKCAERKVYNETIQFVQTIIQDIDITGTIVIEFLCKSKRHWRVREQREPGATSIDLMFIEELEENEVVERHFVEA
jgi:hypothetical protein